MCLYGSSHTCSLSDLSIPLRDILICKENTYHQRDGEYKEPVVIKVGRAGTSDFPHAQMPSKAHQKAGCCGEDPTAQVHQASRNAMVRPRKSPHKDCGHGRHWGNRQTKGKKSPCLQKAQLSRTKLKTTRNDRNLGSSQTGSQAALQKSLIHTWPSATVSS